MEEETSQLNYVTKDEYQESLREITEAYQQVDGMINDLIDIIGKHQKAITDINEATGKNISSINGHSDLLIQLNQEVLTMKGIQNARDRDESNTT